MRAIHSAATISALSLALTSACLSAGSSSTSTATEATGETEATTASTLTGTDGMTSTSVGTETTETTTSTTSMSSTTGTATTATGESTTSTCFICEPDAPPPAFQCDLWTQNCPEGEKCNPWAHDGGGSWSGHKCSPIDPDTDGVGEACSVQGDAVSGIDSCVQGAMCWDVDPETNTGRCVALCAGNETKCTEDPASCCPPGTECTISGDGVLILCLQACDPITQNCESSGQVCYPVGDSFQCAPDVSGDMGAVGDPCEFINACDPGTHCGNPAVYPGCDPMAGGCCIPFCELDNPDCVAGTECEPWYDPMDVPPGYENLGACVIPS